MGTQYIQNIEYVATYIVDKWESVEDGEALLYGTMEGVVLIPNHEMSFFMYA